MKTMDLKRVFDDDRRPGAMVLAKPQAAEAEPVAELPDPAADSGLSPDDLPEPWREWYEERAAIREFDGGQVREHAEGEALKEVLAMMRAAGESV